MNEELKKELLTLLKEKKLLIDLSETPHDYFSVQGRVLQLELQQEIEALQKMLSNLDSFEEELKNRCASRDSGEIAAIPFRELPQSVTNSLYWEIALEVFKPDNLGEMLRIIAPQTKNSIEVSFNDTTLSLNNGENKDKQKKAMKDMLENGLKPVIEKKDGLALDKSPATLDELMHYVLENNVIFDVRTIKDYPLNSHAQLHTLLDDDYPQLSQKIYQHNSDMEQLCSDIDEFIKNGQPPQLIIEQLIKSLKSGGSLLTGSEYADKTAQKGVAQFYKYLKGLPENTLTQLKSLKYENDKTLEHIIEDEIKKGTCVETTAEHLRALLDNNSKEKILTKQLNKNPELEGRYGTRKKRRSETMIVNSNDNNLLLDDKLSVLDTKKSIIGKFTFPKKFTQEAIQCIAPKDSSDLMSLVYNFPSEFYGTLWQHIVLNKPDEDLMDIIDAIAQGFFTPEQKKSLSKAILAQYHRFELKLSLISWVLKSDDVLFVNEALDIYSSEQLLEDVQVFNEDGDTILHEVSLLPDFLEIILERLPKKNRLAMVQMVNKDGEMVLAQAAVDPACLKIILELLPEDKILEAVQTDLHNGVTLLHLGSLPNSLKVIQDLLTDDQMFAALQKTGKNGLTVLHSNAARPASFRTILNLVPKNKILAAAQTKNSEGVSLIIYALEEGLDSFKVILDLLPKDELLTAVQIEHSRGASLLEVTGYFPDCFNAIVEALPEKDKFAVIQENNKAWDKIFKSIKSSPILFNRLLMDLNESFRLGFVQRSDNDGNTVLHYVASQPEFLKAILTLLPENDRFAAVKIVNKRGDTVLYLVASRPDSLKAILDLLPKKDRLAAVKIADEDGDTVLHLVASLPNSLKAILEPLSERDRLAAVTLVGNNGNTVLHYSAVKSDSLKTILDLLLDKDRLGALKIANKSGKTVLNLVAALNCDFLKTILRSLPEENRWDLLKSPIQIKEKMTPVFLFFINKGINNFSEDEAFKNSLAPRIISVVAYLYKQGKSDKRKQQVQFFPEQSEGLMLIKALFLKNTFEEIKEHLEDYVIKNPESALKAGLIQLGISSDNELRSLTM